MAATALGCWRLQAKRCILSANRITRCIATINHRHYTSHPDNKTVKIGCGSGFWGDTSVAAPQLIYGANLDYIVYDYLSEITMSLLTAARRKFPELGYAPDFVQMCLAPYLKDIEKKGVKIITNAGGINPVSCGNAIRSLCKDAGVDLRVAVVTGDDLMPNIEELKKLGITDMDSGASFPKTVNSMTAYLGAGPIARALDSGADIVVTGRCVDSALVLAPLIHSFKWTMDNFDCLAAGSLAGHLIECGAQCTGGIYTDWHKVPDWSNIGFPVVECSANGEFQVTKPPKTGGLVSIGTVSEQLLYEIGDPARYFLPDVVCDFTNVKLQEQGENVVKVTGARGTPPSGEYKVCSTYSDGYRATAVSSIGGPRVKAKAEKTGEAILKRCRRIFKQLNFKDFSKINTEILGTEDIYGANARNPEASREGVSVISVHHPEKKALEFFAREVAPAGTGMAPGLMGLFGGRPKVTPVLKLFSFLYPRDNLKVDIHIDGEHAETFVPPVVPTAEYANKTQKIDYSDSSETKTILPGGDNTYRLEDLAYTRSGDKGNHANVGVIARHPDIYPYLKEQLTEEVVADYFKHKWEDPSEPLSSRIKRFEVPGIFGLNFMLYNSLGGGGIASLRTDPQGKAYGQLLLDIEIKNVPDLTSQIPK